MSNTPIIMTPAHPKIKTARYVFMAFQALIWLIAFPVSIVITGDIVQIGFHSALGLALIVYVPNAFAITLKNRSSTKSRPFDHAGGEVAYLAITIAGWLGSFIWATILVSISFRCTEWYDRSGYWYQAGCNTTAAMSALAMIQVIISSVWLGLVVRMVDRVPGVCRDAAYRISVNQLLRGGEARTRPYSKDRTNEYQELEEARRLNV